MMTCRSENGRHDMGSGQCGDMANGSRAATGSNRSKWQRVSKGEIWEEAQAHPSTGEEPGIDEFIRQSAEYFEIDGIAIDAGDKRVYWEK